MYISLYEPRPLCILYFDSYLSKHLIIVWVFGNDRDGNASRTQWKRTDLPYSFSLPRDLHQLISILLYDYRGKGNAMHGMVPIQHKLSCRLPHLLCYAHCRRSEGMLAVGDYLVGALYPYRK